MSRLGEDIKAGVKGIRGVGETVRGTVNEAADQILDSKQKHPHTQHSQIKNRAIVEKGKTDIDSADEMIARHESKRAGYRQPAATNVDAQHGGEYARPTEGYATGTTGPAVGNTTSTGSNVGARPTEGYTQPTEGYAPPPAGSTPGGNTATRSAEGYGRHPERYDATTSGHTTAHGTAAAADLHARPTEGYAQPTEGYSQPTGGYTPGTSGPATGNMQETAANRHAHHAQPTGRYAPAPTEPTAGLGGTVPGATATADHAPTGGQQSYNEPRMY